MSLTKQKTVRKAQMTEGGLMLGANMGMQENEYMEKPRPNLYNIFKKLKDGKAQVHRILLISKLDETQFRGDFEKEFQTWAT